MDTYFRSRSEVDRTVPDAETGGFVKIHTKRDTDTIYGATIVARHAREMINETGFAMLSAWRLKSRRRQCIPTLPGRIR